jgi:hypothetical protein
MTLALNVFDACRAVKHSDNWAEWAKNNPESAEIYATAMRIRDGN